MGRWRRRGRSHRGVRGRPVVRREPDLGGSRRRCDGGGSRRGRDQRGPARIRPPLLPASARRRPRRSGGSPATGHCAGARADRCRGRCSRRRGSGRRWTDRRRLRPLSKGHVLAHQQSSPQHGIAAGDSSVTNTPTAWTSLRHHRHHPRPTPSRRDPHRRQRRCRLRNSPVALLRPTCDNDAAGSTLRGASSPGRGTGATRVAMTRLTPAPPSWARWPRTRALVR